MNATELEKKIKICPKASKNAIAAAVVATSQRAPPTLPVKVKKALSSAKDYVIANPDGYYRELDTFLEAATPLLTTLLQDEVSAPGTSLKYYLLLEALYDHPEDIQDLFNFKTTTKTLHSTDSLNEMLQNDTAKILQESTEAEMKGSGWSLVAPTTLTIHVSLLRHVKPPGHFISLPKKLRTRKATINIQNSDQACFKYCLLAKSLPQNVDYDRVKLDENSFTNVPNNYNFEGLPFPLPPSKIPLFERRNPGSSINVFEVGPDFQIAPYRIADRELADHTDLLWIKNDQTSHYVLITDFSKLIKPQIAKGSNRIVICKRCFSHKETRRCQPETWLAEHTRFCGNYQPCNVLLPKEGDNQLKFVTYETEIPVPIIVTADFEATLLPTASTDMSYQVHEPNSFCTLVKSTLPDSLLNEVGISTEPYLQRSQNAAQAFLLHMKDLAQRVESLYLRNLPVGPMTEEQTERHRLKSNCDLCERSFNETSEQYGDKTLDHCHITGTYRQTLCNRCNLRCQVPNFIPVYFHNFSGYDQAFIIKNLNCLKGCEVKVLPSNSEKYISVSVRVGRMWIRFLDSYRLMAESLADLAAGLAEVELVESSKLVPADQLHLIKHKGMYPYDYVTSPAVFDEPQLPAREKFYNRLNNEHISESDYERALAVWHGLQMTTFGDYHDFYLRLDVCLLMDTLVSFRNTCLQSYKIDCCHHYTAPGLSFSAMLRMTKITLELITDADQMLMIESAIRGGLVQCNLRYAKANNLLLSDQHDYREDEPSSYLLYLDCVNLYGKAMTSPLPYGDFRWVDTAPDWSSLPTDSPYGFILDCDVEVPATLHDKLQDLPLLPELSNPPGSSSKKLLATLYDKKRYVAHYTVFQQAVQLGLKVTKVHRALRFSQAPWMKKFIDYNANKRSAATSAFAKAFYKLMNNACYGKTMENVRNRVDIRIVTTDKQFQKLVRQTRFVERKIISDDVVAVQMRRNNVKMDKPIYVGMTVLDVSKVHMYHFHYKLMQEHFKAPASKLELAYLDTDGLIYYITTDQDLYTVLKQPSLSQHLDRSGYHDSHPLRDDTNKGKLGTFKDECKDRVMFEFVGLRPKMYAYRFSSTNKSEKRKAKGIKGSYVEQNIRFRHYKNTLFSKETCDKAHFNVIRSKSARVVSTTVIKKSLSAEDDKRQILQCGIRTLPYGHYKLGEEDAATGGNHE